MNGSKKCRNHPHRKSDYILIDGTGICNACWMEKKIRWYELRIEDLENEIVQTGLKLANIKLELEKINRRYDRKR